MILGRWFDSDNPFDRRFAIEVRDGDCYVMSRGNPGDVWSPPKKLHLDTLVVELKERKGATRN